MPNKSIVIFMEAPPKIGASGSVKRVPAKTPVKRTGAAGQLQRLLNSRKWLVTNGAAKPGPKSKTARIAVTLKTP